MTLAAAIRRMPKAEMHLHFEGAFRWATVRELHPDGRALPQTPPWSGRDLGGFEGFVEIFRQYLRPATGTRDAIERHAFEELEDLARQNVRTVELLVSHSFHTARGLTEEQVWESVVRGQERAREVYGIEASLILGVSRSQTPDEAEAIFDQIAGFAVPRGWLAGIDLQSDERARPNRDFTRLYRRAADLGLRLRAHAGEHGGAGNVRDAVELCGVTHISHGVRAVEDPALLRALARAGTWLHVCPTSNLRLGVCSSPASHPLRTLLDAGVRCTVNADDPLLFDTDSSRELLLLSREMGFTRGEIAGIARSGLRSSLLPAEITEAACAEVDAAIEGCI